MIGVDQVNCKRLRRRDEGRFILEVTIIKGYNDDEDSLQKLKSFIKKISPDKTIVERMQDERFKKKLGITDESFERISEILQST